MPHISTEKVPLRKFNRNTRDPGVSGEQLHHWKPAVGVAALLAPFLSFLASKQGSALLHIPDRWTTHRRIKLSADRNLFQRLYRCRCSSERKLRRLQHRDFESNTLSITRGSSATVLQCRSPSSLKLTCPSKFNYFSKTRMLHVFTSLIVAKWAQKSCFIVLLVQWAHASSSHGWPLSRGDIIFI